MIKAESVLSTQRPGAPEEQARAARYMEMETPIIEVGEMAEATALMLNTYMKEKEAFDERTDVTAADLIKRVEHWSDAIAFMVHHLRNMALALRDHY